MSDKTEHPTPKRLRDAREKGDICKSQDVPSALTVLGIGAYVSVMGESAYERLQAMTELVFSVMHLPFEEALPRAMAGVGGTILYIVAPLVGLAMMLALLANFAQVGFLVSIQGAMPKLENLSPQKWFKKVFSLKNVIELIKNLIKTVVLTCAVWTVMQKYLPALFVLSRGNITDLWIVLGRAGRDLLLIAGAVFCVIAALDYFFQRWQYNKEHMMSKDEVKREYKEMEGDPQVKGKRKQLHKELLSQGALDNVRRAKVLVTNPTHYAVALDYEKNTTPLPVVLAKGEGELALRMIAVAKQEGIPIMRNVPLARALFEEGTENAYIPKEFIGPVAEVLRWVQDIEKQSFSKKSGYERDQT